jgi:hypothetical protein
MIWRGVAILRPIFASFQGLPVNRQRSPPLPRVENSLDVHLADHFGGGSASKIGRYVL